MPFCNTCVQVSCLLMVGVGFGFANIKNEFILFSIYIGLIAINKYIYKLNHLLLP